MSVNVIVDDHASGDSLAIDLAHVGKHVEDAQEYAGTLNSLGDAAVNDVTNRTRYDREVRAYTVSSLTAQGLGLPNQSVGKEVIWNSTWAAADRATLRRAGIDAHLRSSSNYGLTPQNPGPRYTEP